MTKAEYVEKVKRAILYVHEALDSEWAEEKCPRCHGEVDTEYLAALHELKPDFEALSADIDVRLTAAETTQTQLFDKR